MASRMIPTAPIPIAASGPHRAIPDSAPADAVLVGHSKHRDHRGRDAIDETMHLFIGRGDDGDAQLLLAEMADRLDDEVALARPGRGGRNNR